jgi:hypothetical protein
MSSIAKQVSNRVAVVLTEPGWAEIHLDGAAPPAGHYVVFGEVIDYRYPSIGLAEERAAFVALEYPDP